MEATIAGTVRRRSAHRRRHRHGSHRRRELRDRVRRPFRNGQGERVAWAALAVAFAVACALGYVKTYPLAIHPPPVIGGKAVPALMVARRQLVRDQLYVLEKRAVRAANLLDDAPGSGPLPPQTFRELQRIHLQYASASASMSSDVQRRIWRALTGVRKAALSNDAAGTRRALRKLQVKLAVARYAP
jgi:hypothetical protein